MMARLRQARQYAKKRAAKLSVPASMSKFMKRQRWTRLMLVRKLAGAPAIAQRKISWGWHEHPKVRNSTFKLRECKPYALLLRGDTADMNTFDEVFKRNSYGRSLAKGQEWVDLGGHGGFFAVRALMAGAKFVHSYEPHPGNRKLYSLNCRGWPCECLAQAVVAPKSSARSVTLHVAANPKNTSRHSIVPVRGRARVHVRTSVTLDDVLQKHTRANAVKMDIEGAELDILEANIKFPARIKTLVFEYSFSHDVSVKRFKKIIKLLKSQFSRVKYPPSALKRPEGVKYHNRDIIVHCQR